MSAEKTVSDICDLLADSFPGGRPSVGKRLDDHWVIRNEEYSLRLTDVLIDHTGDHSPADIAERLLEGDYTSDLRKHGCLEVRDDLTWKPCRSA